MRPASDIKRGLADPAVLVRALALDEGALRQARGFLVRCPWHAERTPSCSVTVAANGHVRVRCFGCGEAGDALSLVAAVRGLDMRADFRRVLDEAAQIADGCAALVDARPIVVAPPQRPPREEVAALWAASARVDRTQVDPDPADLAVAFFLARRRFFPPSLAALDIVRVLPLPSDFTWPKWWPASWARDWRLAVIAYEPDGTPASLHARAVTDATPKTRWPFGYGAGGLLFADAAGVALLRGQVPSGLEGVVLAEGLTDTVAAAIIVAGEGARFAVLGAASGGFGALSRVAWPRGCPAIVAVDGDRAGDRYVAELRAALPRVELRRWRPPTAAA